MLIPNNQNLLFILLPQQSTITKTQQYPNSNLNNNNINGISPLKINSSQSISLTSLSNPMHFPMQHNNSSLSHSNQSIQQFSPTHQITNQQQNINFNEITIPKIDVKPSLKLEVSKPQHHSTETSHIIQTNNNTTNNSSNPNPYSEFINFKNVAIEEITKQNSSQNQLSKNQHQQNTNSNSNEQNIDINIPFTNHQSSVSEFEDNRESSGELFFDTVFGKTLTDKISRRQNLQQLIGNQQNNFIVAVKEATSFHIVYRQGKMEPAGNSINRYLNRSQNITDLFNEYSNLKNYHGKNIEAIHSGLAEFLIIKTKIEEYVIQDSHSESDSDYNPFHEKISGKPRNSSQTDFHGDTPPAKRRRIN